MFIHLCNYYNPKEYCPTDGLSVPFYLYDVLKSLYAYHNILIPYNYLPVYNYCQ